MQNIKADEILVAAIDIGTTLSAYAFSFRGLLINNKINISSSIWSTNSRTKNSRPSTTVPTVVLLNKSKSFLAFGYDAEEQYSALALDEEHHDYYYFCGLKMLQHEIKHTRQTMIKDEHGKEMPALDILSLVIKNLKGHLLETVRSRNALGTKDVIHWVLTVPAIWTEYGIQFMREASKKADISSEHLSICLKPEAAYLHCQYFISGELEDEDVLFNACKSSGEGAKFMVLDLCDETAEITCHHKNAEGSLLQLQKPSGVPWIGSSVDEAFKQFLIKIVGAPVFRKFQKEHTFEAEELLADFKLKKMSLTKESIERVGFKIPVSLLQLFNEDTEEKIQDVLKQTAYGDKLKWSGDKLIMDANIFRALFNEAETHLIEHVKSLLTKSHLKDVSTLLMVGTFSESPIMQSAVKDAFPSMTVFVPPDSGKAVLKGAILYWYRVLFQNRSLLMDH